MSQLDLLGGSPPPEPEPRSRPTEVVIRGLTLWQPMAWAISDFTKRIENRPWPPWRGITHVAIHAGKTYHLPHQLQIEEAFGLHAPGPNEVPRGAIVAVARIAGVVTSSDDPWFSGPVGWKLEDVKKLAEPFPYRGAQGLWEINLPNLQEQLLRLIERTA